MEPVYLLEKCDTESIFAPQSTGFEQYLPLRPGLDVHLPA